MKIEVYNEPIGEESKLRLRLIKERDAVLLCAVDRHGERLSQGTLLRITPDGRVHFCSCVNPELGLKLDEMGCLVGTSGRQA